jgi:hypothetical protein
MAIQTAISEAFPFLPAAAPPINIRELASRRGVIEISEEKLDFDGRISTTASGAYVIHVNKDHSEVRQRFTIAHEIAHTFFLELDDQCNWRYRDTGGERPKRSSSEEFWCNYIAGELLMPNRQFTDCVGQHGPSAKNIRRLANVFRVSLQAAAKRVVQVLRGLNIIVALWEFNPSTLSYTSQWTVRRRASSSDGGRLRITRKDPAFSKFHASDELRGRTWISLGGPSEDYFVDLFAFGALNRRFLLTTFLLESNPAVFFRNPDFVPLPENQLTLF